MDDEPTVRRATDDATRQSPTRAGDAARAADRQRVTGIGGVFFRAADPDALQRWYVEQLGLPEPSADDSTVVFAWRETDGPEATTVWAPFPADTGYFGGNAWMVNFRVRDLDRMLDQLRAGGVRVDDRIEESELGRFGWFTDPEGNRVELWEPSPGR